MAKTPKFPDPSFWKYKDHMDIAAQVDNVKEIYGICVDMAKEADWPAFGKHLLQGWKDFGNRVADEYNTFKGYSRDEQLDIILNGEKHLGRLYKAGSMATVRREWRGVKDTAYDFYEWGRMWFMLLSTFSKDLVPAVNGMLYYRWYVSYFCCHSFMDKNTMGQRGRALRMSHELIYPIFRYVAENLVFLTKCDEKNGNCTELSKKVVLIDEMTMGQIMTGFPDLLGILISFCLCSWCLRSTSLPVYRTLMRSSPTACHLIPVLSRLPSAEPLLLMHCLIWVLVLSPVPCPVTVPQWLLPTWHAASRTSRLSICASPSAIWMKRPFSVVPRTSRPASSSSKKPPVLSGIGTHILRQ